MKTNNNMTDEETIKQFIDMCNMTEKEYDEKYGAGQYKEDTKTADDIKIRHEMYHDVYVYPDGHEEWVQIGD